MCGSDSSIHLIMGKRLNQSQGTNPRNKIGIATTVVKCTTCGLIYSNPQPIPESIQDHYGVSPETYWRNDYFNLNREYFKNEIQTLKNLYNFNEGDKALDIGVGLGKCMIALNNAGFDTFGIEPSEPFFLRAIDKMRISPDRLTLNSIENAQFPNNYFDFITFGAVLEHLYDPSGSIRKAMGWLKTGGIMQIEVPSSDWLISKILNAYYRIRGLDYVTNLSPMHEPFHLYEFSLKSFELGAVKEGYEIVKFEYYVASTFMPKILNFILVPYMRYRNKGMQLCVWLRKSK
ncbi:MAG: class I SAM-dependent methyltransferase [Cyclobacteriaceae bacterium]|nr:class I SAM-dependent methyltransferase [Cyclobacteriaceae bacterium]